MPAVSRLDDPSALPVFLSSISAPDSLASALKATSFNTLGTPAFALSDPSDSELVSSFIWEGDPSATFSPEAFRLRRAIHEACSLAPPSAAAPSAPALVPPGIRPSGKAYSWRVFVLAQGLPFQVSGRAADTEQYPVSGLSVSDPSASLDGSIWLPWRQVTSEYDHLQWEESRRPRSDRQMLRSLLDMPDEVSAQIQLQCLMARPNPCFVAVWTCSRLP
eukprot:s1095_g6.t1